MRPVEEILALLESAGNHNYFGERVSQLEHALQCAWLARKAGAEEATVAAALLHDIGHLCSSGTHEGIGAIDHDEAGSEWLARRGCSYLITELVRGHVQAKRYLTGTNPAYLATLSEASVRTLALQGGPMNEEEASAFASDPLFVEKLRLRAWDDLAKEPGLAVPPLASYRELLAKHLSPKPSA